MAAEMDKKKRLLIVDDDPDLRKLFELGLKKAGFDVLTAENGSVAKTLLESQSVDIVIVDMMMPIMDGLRFLRWLRQEARLTTPALVFTSYDNPKIVEEARAIGVSDVVLKPIQMPQLLEKIKRSLNAGLGDPAPRS